MDAVATQALRSATLTPGSSSRALRLTPMPPKPGGCFTLTHPYVEVVYAPILGPTAIVIARYLGRVVEARPGPIDLDLVAFARELGLRSGDGEVVGQRSHLRRALNRLAHARIVAWLGDWHLSVHTAIPPLSESARDQLPPAARRAHDLFIQWIDHRNGF